MYRGRPPVDAFASLAVVVVVLSFVHSFRESSCRNNSSTCDARSSRVIDAIVAIDGVVIVVQIDSIRFEFEFEL